MPRNWDTLDTLKCFILISVVDFLMWNMVYEPNVISNLLRPQMDPNGRTTCTDFSVCHTSVGTIRHCYRRLLCVLPVGFGGLSHPDEPSICAAPVLDAAAGTAVFFLGSDPWHDSMSQHLALSAKARIWWELVACDSQHIPDLVMTSYWKWSFIVDLLIEHHDFPCLC